jgi:hypothetical protein
VKEFRITIRCEAQPTVHAKVLRLDHKLGREYADCVAGLLDGTSVHYIYPPGPGSPIGKCGICQSKLTATVEEVEIADAKP